MDVVSVDIEEGRALITMDRERGNALNEQMVIQLRDRFQEALHDDNVRGVILAGSRDYFCAGLDIADLYMYEHDDFERFWWSYATLIEELAVFQKPFIAAVTGHAPGNGCTLALCADYRVMADGPFYIGMNTLAAGIVVPESFSALLSHVVGSRAASRMILDASKFRARHALDAGLVDEICPMGDVVECAEKKLRQWFSIHDDAWRKTKFNLRQPLMEMFAQDFRKLYGETLRQWWTPETRTALEQCASAPVRTG